MEYWHKFQPDLVVSAELKLWIYLSLTFGHLDQPEGGDFAFTI